MYSEQKIKMRKKDKYEIKENLPILWKYFGTNLHLKNFELLDFISNNRFNKCLNLTCKADKRVDQLDILQSLFLEGVTQYKKVPSPIKSSSDYTYDPSEGLSAEDITFIKNC